MAFISFSKQDKQNQMKQRKQDKSKIRLDKYNIIGVKIIYKLFALDKIFQVF